MATEMDMDPFEGLRVRPHIAYQNAAVSACKRLGLTAEQLDAGAIDELVKSAKKVITLMNEYNKPPKERNPLILAIDKTRVREGLESALSPFENAVRSDGNGGTR